MRCRVVSWNIHSCVGSDGTYDVKRVADVLASLDADIIGLQEVDWRRDLHKNLDQFAYLASHLDMAAIDGPNVHDHRGRYGNGLLARGEVLDVRRVSLAYGKREPRGAIDATLAIKDSRVRVLVTHLGLVLRERRMQVRLLRERVQEDSDAEATLLLGDMNEWISWRLMRRAFIPNPFAWMASARSFPSRFPVFPLDCIFADPEPRTSVSRVVQTTSARMASDHLPLVADLEW